MCPHLVVLEVPFCLPLPPALSVVARDCLSALTRCCPRPGRRLECCCFADLLSHHRRAATVLPVTISGALGLLPEIGGVFPEAASEASRCQRAEGPVPSKQKVSQSCCRQHWPFLSEPQSSARSPWYPATSSVSHPGIQIQLLYPRPSFQLLSVCTVALAPYFPRDP